MSRPLVSALAAALSLSVLAACGTDEPDDGPGAGAAGTGDIVALAEGAVEGASNSFQLPDREVTVQVDPDLGAVTAADSGDNTAREPEAGLRYVGISWTSKPGAGVPGWLSTLMSNDGGPPDRDSIAASLVVGDERIPIGSPTTDAVVEPGANTLPTFAVTVPDEPGLVLELEFDGQTQSLDLETGELDAGAAQPLYDLPTEQPDPRPCAGSWTARDDAGLRVGKLRPTCGWAVVRLPYVAQGGWAPDPAQPWLVLFADTVLGELRTQRAVYDVVGQSDATEVDGQEPVWRVIDEGGNDAWSSVLVFAGSTAPLEITREATFERRTGVGPDSLELEMSRRLPDVASD